MGEKHSVYVSKKDDCLFNKQFDSWEKFEWNKDMPDFFKRLNRIYDDRSFVILASSVLEYEVDRFLRIFIPNPEKLINKYTPFSKKIDIIKAFQIIPPHLIEMVDLILKIRNDFAHNMKIDSLSQI